MIDRTEFDLRLAAHNAAITRANQREWQQQGGAARRSIRAALAAALIALAARLDSAVLAALPAGGALIPANPA